MRTLDDDDPLAIKARELGATKPSATFNKTTKNGENAGAGPGFRMTAKGLMWSDPSDSERAVVMCLAVDRSQAAIVHRYIGAYFESIPALRKLVIGDPKGTISLTNGVDIEVATETVRISV